MTDSGPTFQNRLLRYLGSADLAVLEPLERVRLDLRQPLDGPGSVEPQIYFVEAGVVSVVVGEGADAAEVGIIGSEGMTGLSWLYGDDQSPFPIFVQLAGSAMRCTPDRLTALLQQSSGARSLLLRYARAFSIQAASTAGANARGKLEERLARWLLMVEDRMGRSFQITHEFVALMLGVRRSGVTLAIQELESRGLIHAVRGSIRIVDREGLIEASAGLYGLAESEYERLIRGSTLLAKLGEYTSAPREHYGFRRAGFLVFRRVRYLNL